jgi:aspartyl-tRNA(Asn)/glutamyl-tRNA(Gln) amidotransferase subunit C
MIQVDNELITKLEQLSRLKLTEADRKKLMVEIEKMISMFSKIGEVDTEGVTPLSHLTDEINVVRDDQVDAWQDTQSLIKLAPESKLDGFIVPKIIP